MRTALTLLALTLGGVLPASALTLDLPVRRPGTPRVAAPAYAGDVLVLQLRAGASVRARTHRRGLATRGVAGADDRVAALGVTAVDALALRLGGATFEPQFRGEMPPPAGSDEPDFTAFYVVHLPRGAELEAALEALRALPEVASADPIAVMPLSLIPNDSLFAASWWLYQSSRRDIHGPEAWDVTTGDSAVVVAVLDTGVLPWHPDLGGSVAGLAGQLWTNWAEAGGVPGVDDDGNGFVDDVRGWDFVNVTDIAPGEDGPDADNDPNDYAGHGTAVAGLVGAIADNAIGMTGVSWRTRLMPLRMGWAYSGSSGLQGEVRMDFAAAAIRYATRMGASVVNCSWESAFDAALAAAVGAAVRAGVTIVNAAGNLTPNIYLATRDDVISVAATDVNDAISAISNTGPYVDLSAPGEGLTSTRVFRVTGGDSITLRRPDYGPISGTSAAAPLVSGVAALIQSQRASAGLRPLTPRGIQLRLMETADDIAAQNPSLVGRYGSGRLNAVRALTEPTSEAWRTRSRSIGAPVVVPSYSNRERFVFLTLNRRLVILDGVHATFDNYRPAVGDTLANQAFAGTPTMGGIAAARIVGATGVYYSAVGLFFATEEGEVHGYDHNGVPLAGWPQAASAGFAPEAGVVLADIAGDSGIEVIAGAEDGSLWAWSQNGEVIPGFPVNVSALPIEMPVAAYPLDSPETQQVQPNDIIVAVGDSLHVIRGDGSRRPGFPVHVPGGAVRAPVVTWFASQELFPGRIVVTAGSQLHMFDRFGVAVPGFPVMLGGTPNQDPGLGDLNGDGSDEIVLVTTSPAMVDVREQSGASLTAQNWPRPLTASVQGPPLVPKSAVFPPSPDRTEVLVMRGSSLLGLSRNADSSGAFAKPGGAGAYGSVFGWCANQVAAGTGPDSNFYVYRIGHCPGVVAGIPERITRWITARGSYARTGTNLFTMGSGYGDLDLGIDDRPPSAINNLRIGTSSTSSVSLSWTAPTDDFGLPSVSYEVRRSTSPVIEATFAGATPVPGAPTPSTPGLTDSMTVSGLPSGTWYFAIRSRDAWGNVSPISNVVQVTVGTGTTGIALAVLEQPSRGSAQFDWRAAPAGQNGPQSIQIYDLTGRRLRVLDLGPGPGGRVQWDGRDARDRRVPAGLYYARLLSGSLHAQTRLVLLP